MGEREPPRLFVFTDEPSGLRAFLVIDDLTLGPAAGGIRTLRYPDAAAAIADATRLARAMTLKCSLAGLDAGGGKVAVIDHDGLDRPRAFAVLGERIEELGGLFRTAGDLGTRPADLRAVARHTGYVHTDESGLAAATGRGLRRSAEACAVVRGVDGERPLAGLRAAVQGSGTIGTAAARALYEAGTRLVVADVEEERSRALAAELGTEVCRPDEILFQPVDLVVPCAVGGVVTEAVAAQVRAWAVCGAANNILADSAAARVLAARGILHVPDIIASAGAVIDGIGASVMGLADRTPLLDRLGETARAVLEEAGRTGLTPTAVAERRAWARIAERRATRESRL